MGQHTSIWVADIIKKGIKAIGPVGDVRAPLWIARKYCAVEPNILNMLDQKRRTSCVDPIQRCLKPELYVQQFGQRERGISACHIHWDV